MDIAGKVALVTGAGSGIGRASAMRLAAEGASVVAVDVNDHGADETVAQIEVDGGKAAATRADVTSVHDVKSMIEFAERTFGGLDILHNNAGIITGEPRYPENEPAHWIRMVEVNLTGVILGTQMAIPAMKKRGGGAIVNTASMAGIGTVSRRTRCTLRPRAASCSSRHRWGPGRTKRTSASTASARAW
jgi:NAD(P)-dependent dehydrogenase (short-subunit alcohol dehydrogenase family)